MSTIPPRFMQELRDRLSLSEIVGRRVKLARAGREFKACCPFHHEKSPSFYVNDDKQFYHCFGCGAHGDAVGFTMRHDNLSFIEAVEVLAAQAGMQVPKSSPQEIARAKEEKDLYALMEDVTRWFEDALREPRHADALGYLTGRGMGDDLIRAFRVGFSPADGQALPRFLKEKGYTEAQMIEAGVVRRSNRDNQPFSFFRDRIMFPVSDRRGRVVAFGGRVMPEHLRPPIADGAAKPPKYINSAETTLFHKGRMLYAQSQARQAAIDGQDIIVVEGYVDVIAAFSGGYRGAVAPLGTALTADQVMVLWKMIPKDQKIPVLCFDGDDAGRRAAARACDVILPLLKPDHSVRLAFLPDGQDPDSLIRGQGPSAFAAVIDAAMPLIDFIWLNHTAGKNFDTPEIRAGLAQALEEEALRIADRNVQHFYRDAFRAKVRELTRIPFKPGGGGRGKAQQKGSFTGGGLVRPGQTLRKPTFTGERIQAMILLACVVNHPALFGWVEDELGRLDMDDPVLSSLRQGILMGLSEAPDLDSAALKAYLNGQGYQETLDLVLSEAVYTHAGFARPDSELDIVRKGWQDTLSFMNRKAVWKELKAAGRALSVDFSDENEQRMMALHRTDRAGQHQD